MSGLIRYVLIVFILLGLSNHSYAKNELETIGVNLSGLEYPWCQYPDEQVLKYLQNKKVKLIRLPIAWERLQPELNNFLDYNELSNLKEFIRNANAHGLSTILDIHNYARFNPKWSDLPESKDTKKLVLGSQSLPISSFSSFWRMLASSLHGTPGLVGYGLMNEPHDLDSKSVWHEAAQQAVLAIRSKDTKTVILVAGYQWSSAKYWLRFNKDMLIYDPSDNLVYEAHIYFDNGSGRYAKTYDEYLNPLETMRHDVFQFISWLEQNKVKGFIGEFGVPANDPRWLELLNDFIVILRQHNVGGSYWYFAYKPVEKRFAWWPIMTGPTFEVGLVPYGAKVEKPQWESLKLD